MEVAEIAVSWAEYHGLIETLAVKLAQASWDGDAVVAVARGGLRVGDVLSRLLRKPLAVVAAASYGADRQRRSLRLGPGIAFAGEVLGDRLLVVDDMVDSGETLAQLVPQLQSQLQPTQLQTAVLWYKGHSRFVPDFYAVHLPHHPWIRQPFERYDTLSIADLGADLGKVQPSARQPTG
ncbi:MAG: phosphoribosyltransferase [Oscillatoriales cyanobacterium SM2_1_8]|nr:phosphoribosyltransferase [Oscillatoriales cyanobacterium SM2_1_8]